MGRRIQRRYGQKEQDTLTTWLIEGTDGVRKMSKSFGNYIGIQEAPGDMFGKIMAIPDGLIIKYFTALTNVPTAEIEAMRQEMGGGKVNPRDLKLRLGEQIVATYHSPAAARKAREEFMRVFSRRELPVEMPIAQVKRNPWNIIDLLTEVGLAPSKSEARRLVRQGGVEVGGRLVTQPEERIVVGDKGVVMRVGKHRFLRLVRK